MWLARSVLPACVACVALIATCTPNPASRVTTRTVQRRPANPVPLSAPPVAPPSTPAPVASAPTLASLRATQGMWELGGWDGGAALVWAATTPSPDDSARPSGDDDAAASWLAARPAGFTVRGTRTIRWRSIDARGNPVGEERSVATVPAEIESLRVVRVAPTERGAAPFAAVVWCRYFELAAAKYELQFVDANGAPIGPRVDLGVVPNRAEGEGHCGLDIVADGASGVRIARHAHATAHRAAVELLEVGFDGAIRSLGIYRTRERLGALFGMIRHPGGTAFGIEVRTDPHDDDVIEPILIDWPDTARAPRISARESFDGVGWTGDRLATLSGVAPPLVALRGGRDDVPLAEPEAHIACEGRALVATFARGVARVSLRAGEGLAPLASLVGQETGVATAAAFTGEGLITASGRRHGDDPHVDHLTWTPCEDIAAGWH